MIFKRLKVSGSSEYSQDSELIYISTFDGLTISYYKHKENTYWSIKCWCIVAYKIINNEFSRDGYLTNTPLEGTFFEILDSPWMKEFDNDRIMCKCKHCIFCFSDHTIEVIAQEFVYEQLKQRPIIEYEWEVLEKDVT